MAFSMLRAPERLLFDDGLTRGRQLQEILSQPVPLRSSSLSGTGTGVNRPNNGLVVNSLLPYNNNNKGKKKRRLSSPVVSSNETTSSAAPPPPPPPTASSSSLSSLPPSQSTKQSSNTPGPAEPAKSKRRLREEAKSRAWATKIEVRRQRERIQAEKDGKLEEFEGRLKKREGETRERRKESGQGGKQRKSNVSLPLLNNDQSKTNGKKRSTHTLDAEDRPDSAGKKRKTSETLPLLNGAPVVPVEAGLGQLEKIKVRSHGVLPMRKKLPIWEHQDALRKCLRERDVLIMLGQTGSGKSTQLGQFLVKEPWVERKNGMGGCIAITQPRRVAATSLAKRVAVEMGVRLGEEVGHSVRFDAKFGKDTKIKFLTDGMLMQEMLQDPLLRKYSAIVVDEAHERTVDTDLVMGFLRTLVYGERRGTLKAVIMSATLDLEAIARYFEEFNGKNLEYNVVGEVEEPIQMDTQYTQKTESNSQESEKVDTLPLLNGNTEDGKGKDKKRKKRKKNKGPLSFDILRTPSPEPEAPPPPPAEEPTEAPVVKADEDYRFFGTTAVYHVPGRQFDVEVFHTPEPVPDYMDMILKVILQIHVREPCPGDILVFLTGQEEIVNLVTTLNEYAQHLDKSVPKLQVLPLYAALSWPQQQRVFLPTPPRTRKIILSTNIAETSVTVSGVRHVIDCGFAKIKQYRPGIGLESLLIERISQSSALQRAGRAGREAPGKCYRIYTEQEFTEQVPTSPPEILRCDLAHALLRLKARGIEDLAKFPFLSCPPRQSLLAALTALYLLQALSNTGAITPLGRVMSLLPLTPPLARVLLAAMKDGLNCAPEVVSVIALLHQDNVFAPPPQDMERWEKWEEASKTFRRSEGDHITLLELFRAYDNTSPAERKQWCKAHFVAATKMTSALNVRKQLREHAERLHRTTTSNNTISIDWDADDNTGPVSPELAERVLKAFLRGFWSNTARIKPDGRTSYQTIETGQEVNIHPSSVLRGEKREALLFQEYVFTNKPYARVVSGVQMDWIEQAREAMEEENSKKNLT